MGAQQYIGVALYEEGVLHVACRMVFGKVERREHVPVIFDFGAFGNCKTKAAEYGYDFFAYNRQRMAGTQAHWRRGAGKVDAAEVGSFVFNSFAECVDFVGSEYFEFVDGGAYGSLLVGGYQTEVGHERRHEAFFTQIFYA